VSVRAVVASMQNTVKTVINGDTEASAGISSSLVEGEGSGHLVGAGRSADIGEGENVNSAAGLEP
jgi:hypothetical protein